MKKGIYVFCARFSYPISFHLRAQAPPKRETAMHEINKEKLCSIECVQNVKGMENLTSCAFFPVIRIAHWQQDERKKLDLQQNSLISGCTCSTIVSFLSLMLSLHVIPEEKKSVISNFLIVIVFVLYCVPLWFFYDLFMKFMLLFLFVGLLRALGTREDHYYAF